MNLRKSLPAVFAAVAALQAFPAGAQSYPEHPVRVVVPFPAGGAADIVARQVAQGLGAGLGQQFVVDNRGGAGGAIGAETAARAPADGYTLLFASSSALSILPHIARKLAYDPLKDFTPIALIGFAPNVLVVHPSVPAKNVKELITVAKAKPGSLNFGSNGTGTLSHLTGELFMQRAGVKMVHIPYKGAAPAVIDTIAGNVSLLFAAYPSISSQTRAGRLRALAVTSAKRMELAPDIPTVAETLPGFESSQWWGLYGPAGLNAAVVNRLNAETNKILKTPDLKRRLAADGAEPAAPGTPQQLAIYHRADFEKWGKVVKAAGIKPEF